jgi:hypothetical protein
MNERRNARIGLVCLVAAALAFGASAAVPGAVGMSKGDVMFVGVIDNLPDGGLIGEWKVAGATVHVTDQTTIDQQRGDAAVGAMVKVRGQLQTDFSVAASRIDVLKSLAPPHGPPQEKSFAVLHLTAADGAPPDAAGVVVTRTFTYADGSAREDLKVGVCHLVPDTEYGVFVDKSGEAIGVIHTDEDGEGHLFLSTAGQPGAESLPEELQPLTELEWVEIRAGETVALFGNFEDARRHDWNHPWVDYLALAVLQDGEDKFLGFAAAAIDGEEQELKFGLWGLIPGQLYTLFVNDDFDLGTFQASQGGAVVVEFSTEPKGNELPFPDGMLSEDGLPSVEGLFAAAVKQGDEEIASGTFHEVPKALTSGGGKLRRRFGH